MQWKAHVPLHLSWPGRHRAGLPVRLRSFSQPAPLDGSMAPAAGSRGWPDLAAAGLAGAARFAAPVSRRQRLHHRRQRGAGLAVRPAGAAPGRQRLGVRPVGPAAGAGLVRAQPGQPADRPAGGWPPAGRRSARLGQDHRHPRPGLTAAGRLRARAVHAGSVAGRSHGHRGMAAAGRTVRVPGRAHLPPVAAGRSTASRRGAAAARP